MNVRLQQFLNLENLTSARFADIMNIQRSNVSHILSGRNKPSWDFIQRFAVKFPNINTDWLLFGKGKPYRESATTPSVINSPVVDDIFAPITPESVEFSIDSEVNYSEDVANESKIPQSSPISQPKSVRRITLYYSDGTFQEFFPR